MGWRVVWYGAPHFTVYEVFAHPSFVSSEFAQPCTFRRLHKTSQAAPFLAVELRDLKRKKRPFEPQGAYHPLKEKARKQITVMGKQQASKRGACKR